MSTETSASGTQLLSRATVLLKLIATYQRVGAKSIDLCRRTGLHRATVHRILQGLTTERLVRQDPQTKRYFLGALIYELGLAATPKLSLRDICKPYLQEIADQTGDTVFMTVRSGFDGVCVARADGSFPIKAFVLDVGRHRPLNAGASGLAILCTLPDEEIERLARVNIERTQKHNPWYSEVDWQRAISEGRKRGYVLNKVMENPPISSIGIAIRYGDGTAAAAISVSTLESRLTHDRLDMVVECLKQAAQSIEKELEIATTHDMNHEH